MKSILVSGIIAAAIVLVGCGKQESSPGGSAPPKPQQADATAAAVPVTQPLLTAWQQGNPAAAIKRFVEADWNARPLFAAGSPLNLSEDQFKALSEADRDAKSNEMLPQIGSFKQLAAAVGEAGRDAVAKGDAAQAQRYFMSLKQCGTALDSPDSLTLLQLVGRALEKMAKTELVKLGQ